MAIIPDGTTSLAPECRREARRGSSRRLTADGRHRASTILAILGAFLIGVSSRRHADGTSPDHPARHPTKHNLHDIVDIAIDVKVPIGDCAVRVPGVGEGIAAVSTFANAFALNCLVIRTVALLAERGIEPPVWRSGNAPGGDAANARFLGRFRGRVRSL
jgi:uncharacterized phosphosugar-binding protein